MDAKRVQKQLNLAAEPDAELLELLDGLDDCPARLHPNSTVLLEIIPLRRVLEALMTQPK